MPENTYRQLDLYHARKAAGRCPRCGGKRDDEYSICSECREYQRQRMAYKEARLTPEKRAIRSAKQRVKQKALRDRRRAEGLCAVCGRPSPDRYMCKVCTDKRKVQKAAQDAAKK